MIKTSCQIPSTLDLTAGKAYNGIVAKNIEEEAAMNEHEPITASEQTTDRDAHEIANLDAVDYMTLLMECRIIQAS